MLQIMKMTQSTTPHVMYYSLGAPVLVDGWKPFQEYNSIRSLGLDGKINILKLQMLILHYYQHSGYHFSVDSQTVSPLTFPPLFTWPLGPKFTWRIVDPGDVSPVEKASSGVGMEGGGESCGGRGRGRGHVIFQFLILVRKVYGG